LGFVAWDQDRASEIISEHALQEGAMLPILHAIQAEFGHIPKPAITMIARALNLSRAEVHGVVTFYHDFREAPAGRHVLKLCRAEACQSMGSDHLAEHAMERLGTAWHGTTEDGKVTLEPIFCLGLCASAPSAMLDGTLVGRLTKARLDALIDQTEAA